MRRGQCSLHCLFFEGNANWTVHSALYIAGLLGSIPQGKERSSEISPLALAHAVRGLYRMKICFLRCSSWECGYWRCSLAPLYHVWRFASLTWLVDALCCAWSLKSPWHLAWHRLQRVVPLTLCHGQLVQKLVMSFCEGQHFARFFQRYWSCSFSFFAQKPVFKKWSLPFSQAWLSQRLLRRFCQENCPGTLRWIFAIPSSCNVKKILWLDQHKFIYPHILTTACNFSSLVWPDGSASAGLSYLFAHLHLLSSDSFSSLIFSLLIFLFSLPLPCSAFHLSMMSEVWLLNFLRL